MKTNPPLLSRTHSRRGMLMTELMVAMAILVIAVIPVGYSFMADANALRADYERAVAMEIVDGETEILAAGAWHSAPEGTHPYVVHAAAAGNLPPGQFLCTRTGNHLRLEWKPDKWRGQGLNMREINVQ